ncbi:MAG: hypothetical protein HKN60_01750 [Rhizobiales bacterium]|nr:hypothetical protein [Hyphomicrobiales bacterium]
MSDGDFNMSLRKFLKRVGITSQHQIEEAVRKARESGALAGSSSIKARMILTIEGLPFEHVVEDEISLEGEV